MLISMEHITKSYYAGQPVLTDVNFSIDQGEMAVIRGASGCGKSTLLNIMGLLDCADSGRFVFDGTAVNGKKLSSYHSMLADDIGFVFQSYYLLESLSVYDNILLPFLYSSKRVSTDVLNEIKALSDELGISHLLQKKASLLSGGEKQRTAICRAMIKKPKIIIADEPTGNLDDRNTDAVVGALQRAVSNGSALVLVTHNKQIDLRGSARYGLNNGVLNRE